MPLSKEQLLIPRYMCTGTPGKPLWFGSPFKHGFIINSSEFENRCYKVDEGTVLWGKQYLDYFPHLFRLMPWWEGRKPDDMPEYVRYDSRITFKATDWKHIGFWECKDADTGKHYMQNELQPATEQEFKDFNLANYLLKISGVTDDLNKQKEG